MKKPAIKRIYEPVADDDGVRVLVDRLWPRGVAKGDAHIDIWAKDIAPSAQLRKWFGHDPKRWDRFRQKYARELAQNDAELEEIRTAAKSGPVTLIYAARDTAHNHARVLADYIAHPERAHD
ncbi:DUF488 domain-containing protein [Mariluticola halotolerans]|uniref:DUF488 domain-containing protein n=1 Tax=Mariluticola halotolerans TaxID=2909283 RepID=UPI0026E14A4F|nr:DUF488 domain-containing protein [Mariluticola halotolerans]UJQ94682.1 DUF488 domain-containing protein [Mariluticola halotolerans]